MLLMLVLHHDFGPPLSILYVGIEQIILKSEESKTMTLQAFGPQKMGLQTMGDADNGANDDDADDVHHLQWAPGTMGVA